MEILKIQRYVIDRTLEIMHKETLDSYRLRSNNTFTSLVELHDIIKRWGEGKIKRFDTVKNVGEEFLYLIKNDNILMSSSYSDVLLKEEVESFIKDVSKPSEKIRIDRILFCLNKLIDDNENTYLGNLFRELDNEIMKSSSIKDEDEFKIPYLNRLNYLISSMLVQLVYNGFSRQHIYLSLKSKESNFHEFWNEIHDLISFKELKFKVIWKFRFKDEWKGCINVNDLGISDNAEVEGIQVSQERYIGNYLNPMKNTAFFSETLEGTDIHSAMKKSRENLMRLFDTIHLGLSNVSLNIPDSVLVCKYGNGNRLTYITTINSNFVMDGFYQKEPSKAINFHSLLEGIYKKTNIDEGVKDRIKSAIRHLNSGDGDPEIEQRFINYWIALEFIFSSPHTGENTFARILEHLINVLASSYVHRNTLYLQQMLIKKGIITEGDDIWKSEDAIDNVISKTELQLIDYQKLKKMKSILFGNKDKRKEYYNRHRTNLTQHISRIYNMRNSLVHEAAVRQDVECITSNLRYYLVFLLDQMFDYFDKAPTSGKKKKTLDDFFNEYINYKKVIEKDYEKELLLKIPVAQRLW